MRKHLSARWMATALLIVPIGCDLSGVPRASSSLEETTVKGTVRVHGKPVNNGSVEFNAEFNAADVSRASVSRRQAAINKDGTYTIKTLVGENHIHVSCRELLTAKNHMFSENEFSLLAGPEENTFDIDIPPGGQEQPGGDPPKSKR